MRVWIVAVVGSVALACAGPAEVAPIEVAPIDAAPVDAAPVDAAPTDGAPVEVAPGTEGKPPAPEVGLQMLRDVYAPYLKGEDVPFFEACACWSKDLKRRMVAARAESDRAGDAPALNGDPFVDAQDWEIADLKLAWTDERRVEAKFTNFGEPKAVVYDLVVEDGAWRIDDTHSSGTSLRAILSGAP